MTASVDHVFVFCQVAAPEQRRLSARGLAVGVAREHAGQGTANVCFGFADAYLELLWLADEQAARSIMSKPLGLAERSRWRATGASPFGVCVRPNASGGEPPFVHWQYRPPYLPPDLTIQMACNSGVVGEPLLFQVDRPFTALPIRHPLSRARLAKVTITVPALAPMSLLREVTVPGLEFRDGEQHRLELDLVTEGDAGTLDLEPDLPVQLRWQRG